MLITKNPSIFFLAILGLLISILWLLSYIRLSSYFKFKIAQAKQREPDNWMLLKEDGEAFADGVSIRIGRDTHNFGIGKYSNLAIVPVMVILFMIFYTGVAVSTFPWQIDLFCIKK